jgi:hypothetical protein
MMDKNRKLTPILLLRNILLKRMLFMIKNMKKLNLISQFFKSLNITMYVRKINYFWDLKF